MDVLLVDDDETLRQSLQLLLESEGYSVTPVASGEEAIKAALIHYFDLVLCDVRMPGIDGLQTIQSLKESVDDAYFVVMTGYASEDAPVRALRLGVDDYLSKPFDIPIFLEKIRSVARRRKQELTSKQQSLWELIASIEEHSPSLAEHYTTVADRAGSMAQSLDLPQDERQLLTLASWFYPLSLPKAQEAPEPSEPDDEPSFTDSLAKLLSNMAGPSRGEPSSDILRACIALATKQDKPSIQNPAVKKLLDKSFQEVPKTEQKPDESLPLEVKTFGAFEVRVNGEHIDNKAWKSAKAKWTFLFLLSRRGQSVPEERLASVFWPGSPAKKAHRALVSSIHRARKALGTPELLARYDRSYGISRDISYSLDSEDFLMLYRQGCQDFYDSNDEPCRKNLEKALTLYKGPYLADCSDLWCEKLRNDFNLKAVDAAEKLAQSFLSDNPSKSESLCRRAISLDASSEPAWATLLRALAAQGRRAEIEATYEDCQSALMEAVGLKPGSSLREAYEDSLD